MRISKLLELAGLLRQYAEQSSGTRQVMADALGKLVESEAKELEREAQDGNG